MTDSVAPANPNAAPHADARTAACTIISPNYLAYARTLAGSYLAQHPGHQFFVLIVADLTDPAPFANEPFQTVMLPALDIPDLRGEAMKYEILELNTNVKPTFMKHLFTTYALDHLLYLDPDIFCYSPLTPVFEALETHDAVLTPHITTPMDDGKSPSEQDHLYNGTYNLGFFATRNTPEGIRILSWWERRCLDNGFSEGRTGLFVDQKWMNLLPGLFAQVAILRYPGTNMAYWNLHERSLAPGDLAIPQVLSPTTTVGPVPLCFFHFSGIVPADPTSLSQHTNRSTLAGRPDLQPLFLAYKAAILANKDQKLESLPYGFDTFSAGTVLTRLARRIYAVHKQHFPEPDPFDARGPFAVFARAEKLVAGKAALPKATWKQFSPTDRRVQTVHKLLRVALRTLGPNRYELLMRYVAFIAVLRHQSVFLNRSLPKTSK